MANTKTTILKKIIKDLELTKSYLRSSEILLSEGQLRDSIPLAIKALENTLYINKKYASNIPTVNLKKKNLSNTVLLANLKALKIQSQYQLAKFPTEQEKNYDKLYLEIQEYIYAIQNYFSKKLLREYINSYIGSAKEILEKPIYRICLGILLSLFGGYWLTINTYDFFMSLPTSKYYSAENHKIFSTGWSDYDSKNKIRLNAGKNASLTIPISGKKDNDIELQLNIASIVASASITNAKTQKVEAYIANTLIGTYDITTTTNKVFFIVPKKLISKNLTNIELLFPNAKSPSSLGLWDDNTLRAICITGIHIDNIDSAPYYRLGRKIQAGKKADSKYFLSGWYEPYKGTRWATGGYSEINLKTPQTSKPLQMNIAIGYILYKSGAIENQKLKFYINNRYLTESTIDKSIRQLTVDIPSEFIINTKNLRIGFSCPNAAIPQELGLWNDKNRLAFTIKTFSLNHK